MVAVFGFALRVLVGDDYVCFFFWILVILRVLRLYVGLLVCLRRGCWAVRFGFWGVKLWFCGLSGSGLGLCCL